MLIKNYIVLGIGIIAFTTSIHGYSANVQKQFIDAIEHSKLSDVKSLLETKGKEITAEQKKELLSLASKVEHERQNSSTLLKSKWEFVPLIGVSCLTIGACLIVVGAYLTNQGLRGIEAARSEEVKAKEAKTIEELIENIAIDDNAGTLPQ